jgi:hypothetical protein
MKQGPNRPDDEMRPEYDLSHGVRGKHHAAYRAGTNVVLLDADVARAFPDSASVNRALRLLLDQPPEKPRSLLRANAACTITTNVARPDRRPRHHRHPVATPRRPPWCPPHRSTVGPETASTPRSRLREPPLADDERAPSIATPVRMEFLAGTRRRTDRCRLPQVARSWRVARRVTSMTPAHDCAPVVVSGAASGRPCDDVRSDI